MKQRGLRKLVSMILAMVMCLGLTCTAFAESATITITNATVGKEYSAYKVFEATTDGTNVSYTISEGDDFYDVVSAASDVFTLTQAGSGSTTYYVTIVDGKTEEDIRSVFADVDLTSYEATDSKTAESESVTLNVTTGYYFVTSSLGSVVTITTSANSVKIIDKNRKPGSDLEKTVSDTEAQIGNSVNYTITSDVPAYDGTTKITNYTFVDTLDGGLTAPASTEVTVVITDDSGESVETGNAITVTVENNVITVTYEPEDITDYPADATITISYTATVNAQAAFENGNSVTQTWTEDSTGKTVTEEVYTYGFKLKKIDGTSKEQLSGAKFKLYTSETEGNAITFTKDSSSNTYTVDPNGTVTEIEAGYVTIFGLDSDVTYYLEETQAPAGYNVLEDRVAVTIDKTGTSESEGVVTISQEVKVENNSGTELPSTGGIGTTIFYIVGGVLVLGAAVLFVTKRRLSNEN